MVGTADLAGFTSIGGVTRLFSVPNTDSTTPEAVNATGLVVGFSSVSTKSTGFTYDGTGFPTLAVFNALDTMPRAVNAAGLVTGYYRDTQGNYHGFLATLVAVPEPAAAGLLALGLAGLFGARLGRRTA